MSVLTSEQVTTVFMDCMFKQGEEHLHGTAVKAPAIMATFRFHPERLESHKATIKAMLAELPDEFQAWSGGSGWSFLNGCIDKHGRQWTGEHQVMDQLFALGIGIGEVMCPVPRLLWDVLPGGMPYYVVGRVEDANQDV